VPGIHKAANPGAEAFSGRLRPAWLGLIGLRRFWRSVDAEDVRIFCELAFQDLGSSAFVRRAPSPAEIGKTLSMDEKTVRLRVRRMEESGFIKYYQATPELALFGLKRLALYRFEAMNVPTKHGVIQHVHGMPGIVQVADYLGPTVSVSVAGASPDKVVQLGDEIAGRFELKKTTLGEGVIEAPEMKLDSIDWRIVQRLRYDARSAHKDVAEAVSITARMAEYRTRKLLDSGAVRVRAVINPQRQEGLVFYEVEVTVEPSKRASVLSAVQQRHKESIWSLQEPAPGTILLSLFAFTLAQPEAVAMELLTVPGVRYCSILILKEILEPARPNWIDTLIQSEAAGAE